MNAHMCFICGHVSNQVTMAPERNWLKREVPNYECTDRDSCYARYDRKTIEEGWLY